MTALVLWKRSAKLADGRNSDVYEAMLSKDVFTDQTATLLNPMSNLGIDGGSGQERLHDRHFVGLDQGVSGFVREEAETRHRDIFASKNFLSTAPRWKAST
jgi:hypothetical protein